MVTLLYAALSSMSIFAVKKLFFLVSNSSLRTFSCSSVCFCFLSTNWQGFSMTNTSVASDFLQTFDVHSDFSSQITFYNLSFIDYSTNSFNFFVCNISHTSIWINVSFFQNTSSACSTDSVDISLSDFNTFFSW